MNKKNLHQQKYQGSHISKKNLHQIWWRLHDKLESNPQLWKEQTSLKEFCTLLKTNQKYFSQTVGQATGGTILNLIHCYRINDFLRKLENGEVELKTIEGLLFETGFKNRSSFYTAFRKIIGCTVSEMLTQINQKENLTCP